MINIQSKNGNSKFFFPPYPVRMLMGIWGLRHKTCISPACLMGEYFKTHFIGTTRPDSQA